MQQYNVVEAISGMAGVNLFKSAEIRGKKRKTTVWKERNVRIEAGVGGGGEQRTSLAGNQLDVRW